MRLLLFILALALAVPAAADTFTDQAGNRLMVTRDDQLVSIDPSTGQVRVLFRERGLRNQTLTGLGEDRWLLLDPGKSLRIVDAQGTVSEPYALPGEVLWGPEKQEDGAIAFIVEGAPPRLIQLGPDGKERSSWEVPKKPDVVYRVDGNWFLKFTPDPPEEPDYGFRRAPPKGTEPPPEPLPERLVLMDGKTGEVLWSLIPEGPIDAGPWQLGGRIVEVEAGGDEENPLFLVSLQPVPQIVKELERPWNYPIQELPKYQWARPLEGPLVGTPAQLENNRLLTVVHQDEPLQDRVLVVDEDSGEVAWDLVLPHPITVDGGGAPMIHVLGGQLWVFLTAEKDTRVMVLNEQTGTEENEFELKGTPAHVLTYKDKLYVFLKSSQGETQLDTGGNPVRDLNKRQEVQRFVDSYRLVELGDEARTLAEGARDSLVGDPVLEGDRLYYATRETPAQQPGQRVPVNVKYPQEPILLHAMDLATGQEAWVYRPADDEHRVDSWSLQDGVILVETPDKRIFELKLDGQVGWTSEPLDDSGADISKVGEFWLIQIGERFYALEGDGKLNWKHSFIPLFDQEKLPVLLGVIILLGAVTVFIQLARRRDLFIRRIAGLNAIDEAVGRATEMGKPVLYVHGLADVDDIQILASLSILGHVARKTAEYDTPILVPCSRSVVMSTAQEVVKESYTQAGRPDAFQRDNINYLTDEQFGYVAGVDGIMLRERPAANFYLGTFYAESLILAETGHSTGAIQIAGTAMPAQLPFFVAACDYTLIGEELYAASAYLSRDPLQVGSLRGQDVGKAIIMLYIFLGTALLSLGYPFLKEWLSK